MNGFCLVQLDLSDVIAGHHIHDIPWTNGIQDPIGLAFTPRFINQMQPFQDVTNPLWISRFISTLPHQGGRAHDNFSQLA
jgi:hypothetical protein